MCVCVRAFVPAYVRACVRACMCALLLGGGLCLMTNVCVVCFDVLVFVCLFFKYIFDLLFEYEMYAQGSFEKGRSKTPLLLLLLLASSSSSL